MILVMTGKARIQLVVKTMMLRREQMGLWGYLRLSLNEGQVSRTLVKSLREEEKNVDRKAGDLVLRIEPQTVIAFLWRRLSGRLLKL